MKNDLSIKITNAINQLNSRSGEIDGASSTYTTPTGEKFNTKERIVTSIPTVETKRPLDHELFANSDGKPDWRFMVNHFKKEGHLTEAQLIKIIDDASQIMSKEPNLLQVGVPSTVIGDIHGQLFDLFQMFECSGYPDEKPNMNYIFLGDYVDRGDRSIEVLILLYALKINYPNRIFLLRGNHECKRMTEYFTFELECKKRYSEELFNSSVNSFKSLPLAAILNEQFFCVHAGISSELISLDQINQIDRFVVNTPSNGIFCDLLWSDPDNDYDSKVLTAVNSTELFSFNMDRRCSEFYSYQAVLNFLNMNDLLCVIRGHQPQDSGYRMYKTNTETHFPTLITLFSAPNYCHTYQNKAATLIYDGELFNIKQFDSNKETPYYLPDFMNALEWSLPFAAEKVLDILTAVLNITSNEELETSLPVDTITEAFKKTKIIDDEMIPIVESNEICASVEENPTDDMLQRKLRTKLLAMGRMSRMLGLLRSEVENVEQLKDFNNGVLPKCTLINGREELHNRLQNFTEARDLDLKNEGLPPTYDESIN